MLTFFAVSFFPLHAFERFPSGEHRFLARRRPPLRCTPRIEALGVVRQEFYLLILGCSLPRACGLSWPRGSSSSSRSSSGSSGSNGGGGAPLIPSSFQKVATCSGHVMCRSRHPQSSRRCWTPRSPLRFSASLLVCAARGRRHPCNRRVFGPSHLESGNPLGVRSAL